MELRRHLALFIASLLAIQPVIFHAWADEDMGRFKESSGGLSLSNELNLGPAASEFFAGRAPGVVMMRVNLWGGVQKPGIYNVPLGTDLVTLLSYAGGPTGRAKMDDVEIKRRSTEGEKVLKVDVDKMVSESGPTAPEVNPVLKVNDVVVIPESHPLFGENTLVVLGVFSLIASITLSAVLIRNGTRQ